MRPKMLGWLAGALACLWATALFAQPPKEVPPAAAPTVAPSQPQPSASKPAAPAAAALLPYVDINVEQLSDRVVLRFDGRDHPLPRARITPSRTGVLVVIPEHRFESRELNVVNARIGQVELSNSGRNAALRLIQRANAVGTMRDHVLTEQGNGTLVLTVLHGGSPPTEAQAAAPSAQDTRQALVALLGSEKEPAPSDAGIAATDTPAAAKAEAEPSRELAAPTSAEEKTAVEAPAASVTAAAPDWLHDEKKTPQAAAPTNGTTSLVWPSLLLTVVVAAAGAGLVAWQRKQRGVIPRDRSLQMIERLHLGPKHALIRVRIDERELLLSQSEAGLHIMLELGDSLSSLPQHAAARTTRVTAAPSPMSSPQADTQANERLKEFKQRLSAALRAEAARGPDDEESNRSRNSREVA